MVQKEIPDIKFLPLLALPPGRVTSGSAGPRISKQDIQDLQAPVSAQPKQPGATQVCLNMKQRGERDEQRGNSCFPPSGNSVQLQGPQEGPLAAGDSFLLPRLAPNQHSPLKEGGVWVTFMVLIVLPQSPGLSRETQGSATLRGKIFPVRVDKKAASNAGAPAKSSAPALLLHFTSSTHSHR